jgi:hypothetical protein
LARAREESTGRGAADPRGRNRRATPEPPGDRGTGELPDDVGRELADRLDLGTGLVAVLDDASAGVPVLITSPGEKVVDSER